MWYRDFFPRSRPRQARGGIKAQSKRGSFGESWWAKRWIQVLESFQIGARLGRGRSYARQGQVLSIEVDKGVVQAEVQGSRPKPYKISIKLKPLSKEDWKQLVAVLAAQPLFAAKLLAGEMPQDIEKAFAEVGLALFPKKHADLETACSCPDYSNPCKHIAAVYYLLGEEFDRDPFLLFKLRGLDREDLIKQLSGDAKTAGKNTSSPATPEAAPETLPTDLARFWSGGPLPADFFREVRPAPVHAALPRRLGNFPFWRGQERFLDAVEPIYRQAAEYALEILAGSEGGQTTKES
jgi:uncharacterized Zn finger protein